MGGKKKKGRSVVLLYATYPELVNLGLKKYLSGEGVRNTSDVTAAQMKCPQVLGDIPTHCKGGDHFL